jgi:hypothetical protein
LLEKELGMKAEFEDWLLTKLKTIITDNTDILL